MNTWKRISRRNFGSSLFRSTHLLCEVVKSEGRRVLSDYLKVILLLFSLFLVPTGTALAQIRVVILYSADSDPVWDTVQSKLMATGQFAAVDLIQSDQATPSLSSLQSYQAVLCFGVTSPLFGWGYILAQFVEDGGGVVQATFADCTDVGAELLGFSDNPSYQALVPAPVANIPLTLGTVALPDHERRAKFR